MPLNFFLIRLPAKYKGFLFIKTFLKYFMYSVAFKRYITSIQDVIFRGSSRMGGCPKSPRPLLP